MEIILKEHQLQWYNENKEKLMSKNRQFNFICNKDMNIKVKSSMINTDGTSSGHWVFISRNQTTGYLLCLAFNSREDLNPSHIWLIPASVLNHLVGIVISEPTISKWNKYKLDI